MSTKTQTPTCPQREPVRFGGWVIRRDQKGENENRSAGKCSIKRSSKGKGLKPVALAHALGVWRESVRVGRGNPSIQDRVIASQATRVFFLLQRTLKAFIKRRLRRERREESAYKTRSAASQANRAFIAANSGNGYQKEIQKGEKRGAYTRPVALVRTLDVWRESLQIGRGNPSDSGSGHCPGNANFFIPADAENVCQKAGKEEKRRFDSPVAIQWTPGVFNEKRLGKGNEDLITLVRGLEI
ncbi:hypothetical protein B0H14DRAFT_2612935 [Mycena olivaceomarginata]|nr:hypothetical protein B0H14DRAFT_2612935 [Mycena olivaceomarginata]